MTPQERGERFAEALVIQGVDKNMAAPGLYRALWGMGIEARPPLAQSFFRSSIAIGLLFAVPYTLVALFASWGTDVVGFQLARTLFFSVLAAALFGPFLAGMMQMQKLRLKNQGIDIPEW